MSKGEVVNLPVKPKTEGAKYEGHTYTVTYDPNAPSDQRWFFHVKFIHVLDIVGAKPTLRDAHNKARQSIREMNKHVEHGHI